MDERKKKIGIVTVCSLILVAMVVALVVTGRDEESEQAPDVSSSQKAITTICETTDYQKACVDRLNASGKNTSNPKELIEVAFQAAIKQIKEAAKNSTALIKIEKDTRAKSALESCEELADRAINDLERSFAKFNTFDITNVDDILVELKIWLSGAITYQETCLDGFDEVPGDVGLKMKDALTTAMQMTSNALAMVAELSTFLESLGIQSFQSRRLLSEDRGLPVLGHSDEIPDWMEFNRRRLLTVPPQQIKERADIVVAKDGSGKYTTINEALKHIPKKGNKTFVLYIKEGVYEEKVQINSSFTHLMMLGDGPTRTRITGKLNFIDGTSTYHTATVAVQGDDFIARDIGFENSAGPEKHQAVALRVSADKAIFYNCHMDGAAVFQGCTMVVRKPLDNQQCIVTAQGRKDVRQPTGLVLQNCTFKADPEYYPVRHKIKSYLGRPWKEYSRTIIMESFLDDLIQPEGWLPWNQTFALETLFYTEFNNRGPAAPKQQRVKWPGVRELPPNRIQRFTAAEFLDGNRWIPPTQIPYAAGFIFPVPKEDPNIKYSPVVPEENKDLGPTIDKGSFNNKNQTTSDSTPPPVSVPPPSPPREVSVSTPPPSPPSESPISTPPSDIAASPSTSSFSAPSNKAASPTTSPIGSYVIASPPTAPTGSPISIPQLDATAPSTSPSASPISTPQPDIAASPTTGVPIPSENASPTTISPSGSSVLSPESDITASPTISPTGSSTLTTAPPLASPSESLAPTPQSNIAATPESSYSYAAAPAN
ncbi:Pectinesterase [Handroanthus impetiginosus]|uniref:Pectinesterase n=1 Tax=Handroanthus impetiginosus TaxID=429701 RepID=A0A2G9GI56_9LAMI|nr:Pectinesterase [Handroanthus impetiginosus]